MARDYLPLALASTIPETGPLLTSADLYQTDPSFWTGGNLLNCAVDDFKSIWWQGGSLRYIESKADGSYNTTFPVTPAAFPGNNQYAAGVGFINGKFYVLGGNNSSTYQSSSWVLNLATGAWTGVAATPTPMYFCASTTMGGKIYVKVELTSSGNNYGNEIWCYDPVGNTWTKIATLATVCTGGQFWSYGGFLYYKVGYNGSANSNVLYRISLGGTVTTMAPAPLAQQQGSTAVVMDGFAYIVGGTVYNWAMMVYDCVNDSWSLMSTPFRTGNEFMGASSITPAMALNNLKTGNIEMFACSFNNSGTVNSTSSSNYTSWLMKWPARGRLPHAGNLRALKAIVAS